MNEGLESLQPQEMMHHKCDRSCAENDHNSIDDVPLVVPHISRCVLDKL